MTDRFNFLCLNDFRECACFFTTEVESTGGHWGSPVVCPPCPTCGSESKFIGRPCAVNHGLDKGPGSGGHEFVFDRPNPEKDILRTAKIMEANGSMTPQNAKVIKEKLAQLKADPPQKVDYGKEGHSFDH